MDTTLALPPTKHLDMNKTEALKQRVNGEAELSIKR